jgi:hypothetical protein
MNTTPQNTSAPKSRSWHVNSAAILNLLVTAGAYAGMLPPKAGLLVGALATGAAAYVHGASRKP